ncbi:PqqD family peptide modification chaperone [Nocardioides montaniterrae]
MQIRRATGVVEAQFDQVRVLLNDDLEYLGLDEVGQRIWDLLAAPQTLPSLVGTLTDEYDVSRDDCARDVTSFVQALERHHLVSTS